MRSGGRWSWILVPLLWSGCGPLPETDGRAASELEQSIIGGSPSPASAFPAVAVQLTTGEIMGYPVGSMVCTGTLIAPDVVLTAAHCTEIDALVFGGAGSNIRNSISFELDVSGFGVQDLNLPADAIPVRAMAAHPSWDINNLNSFPGGLVDLFDIALLFLERTSSRIPAVVLDEADLGGVVVGAQVDIVGYGQRDSSDTTLVGIKYQARSFINEVGTSEMQIGDQPPGDPQKCHGDSGGPTFITMSDGRTPSRRLVGVTSHAYDDTDCAKGGVDTMISPYRAWIDQAMRQACTAHLRSSCTGGGGLPTPAGGSTTIDAGLTGSDAQGVDRSVDPGRDSGPRPDAIALDRHSPGGAALPPPMPPDVSDGGCACRQPQSSPLGWGLWLVAVLGWRARASYRRRPASDPRL
ncbi:MAG: trypsin-like serine protease [Pseudomonadota bacterium]